MCHTLISRYISPTSLFGSEVYSADMFASRFKAEGIFSPKTGASYRAEVLAPGGSRDAVESLRKFLGRDPIPEPFLASKGLTVSA
tara:strand:+ start:863 stop:1117 length:255 start_codon:yes stop_codon:yes gene_type:complete